jgi:hypothetical protein
VALASSLGVLLAAAASLASAVTPTISAPTVPTVVIVLVALTAGFGVLLPAAAALIIVIAPASVSTAAIAAVVVVVSTARFATLATDLRHVLTILADRFAALATGFAGFFRIELVGVSALVSRFTALAGDLSLLVFVHRSKTAFIFVVVCHGTFPFSPGMTRSSTAVVRQFKPLKAAAPLLRNQRSCRLDSNCANLS